MWGWGGNEGIEAIRGGRKCGGEGGGNEEMVRGNAGLGGGNLKHTFSHCRGKNT